MINDSLSGLYSQMTPKPDAFQKISTRSGAQVLVP